MDQHVLLEHVSQAAHDLVSDLQQAQRETGDWNQSERAWPLVSAALDRCLASLSRTGCWGEQVVEVIYPFPWPGGRRSL